MLRSKVALYEALNKCPAVSLQNRSATSLLWELLDLYFCRSTVVFIYLVIFILLCVNVHGGYLSEFILSQISSGCVRKKQKTKKKKSVNIAHCTKCDIVKF